MWWRICAPGDAGAGGHYLGPMDEIPDKSAILAWIAEHPTESSKRDIARAFGVKGAARIDLKRVLRELEEEGHLQRRRRSYRDPDALPPVSVLEVRPGPDGDLFARPLEWQGEGPAPTVLVLPREGDPALGAGDRILARLAKVDVEDRDYEGAADPADRGEPAADPRDLPDRRRGRPGGADRQGIGPGVARAARGDGGSAGRRARRGRGAGDARGARAAAGAV